MKIPFVGASYAARSLNADAQRAVNVYLETDATSERAPLVLYGRPGYSLAATIGTNHRGSIVMGSFAYVVSGNTVYKVDTAYTATALGTINTNTGPVGLAHDGTEVLIVDGNAGWLATTSALTQITDPDFPNGVTQCACVDGYFLVVGDGTDQVYCDETPRNGASWVGTDFASAEGAPDNTIAIIQNHREVWLAGSQSAEVWSDTGNPDFPFERVSNVFIERGISAPFSLVKMDSTLYWLGQDLTGANIVFKAAGYTPQRISNHALEKAISGYVTSDAQAFAFQMEGHSFYVLTFPTSDATWAYDEASQQWFEWGWRNPSLNTLHRWRPNSYCFFNGQHLVGDWETGKMYTLSLDVFQDNGDPMLCLRASQTQNADGKRLFYRSMQVDMEAGVGGLAGGTMMMRYSNDGGHTWSGIKQKSVGGSGEYGYRVKFGPSGAGRNRVWEISRTDNYKFAVLGAFADAEVGT